MFIHEFDLEKQFAWNWKIRHFKNELYTNRKEPFFIVDVGSDPHKGKIGSDRTVWTRFLREPYPKVILGDLIEMISPADKRYRLSEHGGFSAMQAYHELLYELEKYGKDKIIGIGRGNHELTFFRNEGNIYEENITDDETGEIITAGLCPTLHTKYLGPISYLVFKYKGNITTWQVGHPTKGSIRYRIGHEKRKVCNEEIKAEALQSHVSEADAYFAGHYHVGIVSGPTYTARKKLTWDDNLKKLVPKHVCVDHRYYCTTPCFVRSYPMGKEGGYEEDAYYELGDVGWLRVWMDAKMNIVDIKKIHVDENNKVTEEGVKVRFIH